MKSTLVIGASPEPSRYAHQAILLLQKHGHPVIAFGKQKGVVNGVRIEQKWDPKWKVDTVTLYINPTIQEQYYSRLIELNPNRVIFNPGTENRELMELLEKNGVGYEVACTLVLLTLGQY